MKGVFIAMKNILSEFSDTRLPRNVQLRRLRSVIERELTPIQREILCAVYYEGKTQRQVARERGVSGSTVCRTLHRAERRLQRFLRY